MTGPGRVALITGASRGIGAAVARAFVRSGTAVAMAARRPDVLVQLGDQLERVGGKVLTVPTDVTDEAAVARLVDQTLATFGRLDVAVNNAGGGGGALTPAAELDWAAVESAIELNVHGVFACLQHEIPAILAAGGGAIVNISSRAGLAAPSPGTTPYVTAKHALQGLTKTAALDYASRNLRINAIAPGPIQTDLLDSAGEESRRRIAQRLPMRRLGRPDEVAAAAVWLCSAEASFITGATLEVDGGLAAM